jgi:hypothetical protein
MGIEQSFCPLQVEDKVGQIARGLSDLERSNESWPVWPILKDENATPGVGVVDVLELEAVG